MRPDVSQVPVLNTKEADVAYLLRREDNPRYNEEGFYDPTCETGMARRDYKGL